SGISKGNCSPMGWGPPYRIPGEPLKTDFKEAATCSYFSELTVDKENRSTKKHNRSVVRSEKVVIHKGAPGDCSFGFFLYIEPYSFNPFSPHPVPLGRREEGFKFFFDN